MSETHTIAFVLRGEDELRIKEWAAEEDRTVSALMRKIVLAALRERDASREESAEGK